MITAAYTVGLNDNENISITIIQLSITIITMHDAMHSLSTPNILL